MFYQGADDPHLILDLRTALRHWSKADLGNVSLVHRLRVVDYCMVTDTAVSRCAAAKQAIRAALARLHAEGQAGEAALLERRYLRGDGVHHLCSDYHLSERSLYYRLEQALGNLAQALWAEEQSAGDLLSESAQPVVPPAGLWRARHLPPATYDCLFGVEDVLARLQACLEDRAGCPVVSLEGMGGLGKTALAREVALRLAQTERFAGVAWQAVQPESFASRQPAPAVGAALTWPQLLACIAGQLGDNEAQPASLPALFQARSYLVVLDNLNPAFDGDALPDRLCELAGRSRFLLTGRRRLMPGRGLTSVLLDELAEGDALALLRHEALRRGLVEIHRAGDEALSPVLEAVGGNPLALKVVAGQLGSLPLQRVLSLYRRATAGQDPFYQHLYRRCWASLPEPARRLLRFLALLPAGGAMWDEMLRLTGLAEEELTGVVDELTACCLLRSGGVPVKTYTIHRLTRHFVHSQAMGQPTWEPEVLRLGESLLAYARQHEQDWPMLARREEHLLLALERCVQAGPAGMRIAVELAIALNLYMIRRGAAAAWEPYLSLALEAAGALGDEAARADLWNQLALLRAAGGKLEAALRLYQQAADAFRRLDRPLKLAQTLRWQGNAYYSRPDAAAALACYRQALDLLAGAGQPAEMSHVLNNIANVHSNEGRPADALAHYRQALELLDMQRDRPYVGTLLNNVGLLHWQLGHWRQATAVLARASAVHRETGDRVALANTHHYLCLAYADLEEWGPSFAHGRWAQALRQELDAVEEMADLLTDLADVYLRWGDEGLALELVNRAEPLWQEADRPEGLGRACLVRGDLHGRLEQWHPAQAAYRQALDLLQPKTDAARRVHALLGLGRARFRLGQDAGAEDALGRAEALIQDLGRADLQVELLWLRAEWTAAERAPLLQAALALCAEAEAGDDRLLRLGRETQARLHALCPAG